MDPRLTTRFGVAKPAGTHRRPARCDEVDCKYLRDGWQMRIMEGTPLGDRQVALIKQSGRRYTTSPGRGSALYTFEAGQQCFRAHTVDIGKPALYLARQGAGPVQRIARPEDWVGEFSSHLDHIREQ
jgi:hypothetical protein